MFVVIYCRHETNKRNFEIYEGYELNSENYISKLNFALNIAIKLNEMFINSPASQGGTQSIHDREGGSDVFFWVENLHARYFLGSRDLSRIFLGLKIKTVRVFFGSYLQANFRYDQCRIRKIFIRTFFSDVCSWTFVMLSLGWKF